MFVLKHKNGLVCVHMNLD